MKIFNNSFFLAAKIIFFSAAIGAVASALLFYFGWLAFAGAAALALIVAVAIKPKVGIFVLLAAQVLLPRSAEGITKADVFFMVVFAATILGWILKQFRRQKISTAKSPLNLPIILFLTVSIFSCAAALYYGVPFIGWLKVFQPFLILLLFFVVINEFESEKSLKLLLWEFLAVAAAISLSDIISGVKSGGFASIGQLAGDQYHSLYFIFAIPISIALFMTAKNFWARWIQVPLIAFFVFRIAVSFVRSYLLVFFAGIILFQIILQVFRITAQKKLFYRILSLAVIACFSLAMIYLNFHQYIDASILRYSQRFATLAQFDSMVNESVLDRIAESEAVWDIVLQQPIIGHGYGFSYQYYRPTGELCDYNYVHNAPLYFLLTTGIVGFLAVLWLMFEAISLAWKNIKNETDVAWKIISAAIFINFWAIAILSFFITSVVRQDTIFYLALAFGIIAARAHMRRETTNNTADKKRSLGYPPLSSEQAE